MAQDAKQDVGKAVELTELTISELRVRRVRRSFRMDLPFRPVPAVLRFPVVEWRHLALTYAPTPVVPSAPSLVVVGGGGSRLLQPSSATEGRCPPARLPTTPSSPPSTLPHGVEESF